MGKHSNNDIGFIKNKTNDNDNGGKEKYLAVDKLADALVEIYDAPNSRRFFCKVAWKLPEWLIRNAVESSKRGGITSPVKYFVRLCSIEMKKRQQQDFGGKM